MEKYIELQKLGETDEEKLFVETGKALLAEGVILRRVGEARAVSIFIIKIVVRMSCLFVRGYTRSFSEAGKRYSSEGLVFFLQPWLMCLRKTPSQVLLGGMYWDFVLVTET